MEDTVPVDERYGEYDRIIKSKEKVQEFIANNLPGYHLKTVPGDGLCMVRAFSTCLLETTGTHYEVRDLTRKLRREILNRCDFYQNYSQAHVNVLAELDKFLDNPLANYSSETSDLFLTALGNALKVNIILFQSDDTVCRIVDICQPTSDAGELPTIYLARTLSEHIDPVVKIQIDNISNDGDSGDDIIMTNYIPGTEQEQPETISDDDICITFVVKGEPTNLAQMKTETDDNNDNDEPEIDTDSSDVYSDDSSSSEEDIIPFITEQGQRVLREMSWRNVERKTLTNVPFDINGLVAYKLYASSRDELLSKCKDGRPWGKDTTTKWSGYLTVRYRDCKGGICCPNLQCPYLIKYKEQNKLKFTKDTSCSLCGALGESFSCDARKYIAFNTETKATIFHYGKHKCTAKIPSQRAKDLVSKAMAIDPSIKPSTIQTSAILTAMRKRSPWNEVSQVVRKLTDKKAIANEKAKQRQKLYPNAEGYNAVKEYKSYTDEKDKFLIYEVNEVEQYVFKTSAKKMKIGKDMQTEGEIMSEEYCFFDGKENRCKNFTTLTASTYHPLLQRQIPLATMDCKSEDSANVGRFWKTFNKAYKEENSTESRFTPKGWISDMASSNFNGLQMMYGEDVLNKIKGCEFHFRQSINRRSSKFEDDKFKGLATELLQASTEEAYASAYENLKKFIEASVHADMLDWLKWWHDRRYSIFRAFTGQLHPRTNQAEVVHASWKNRGETGLSLYQSAEFDTKDTLIVEAELEEFKHVTKGKGSGPNLLQINQENDRREVSAASRGGRDIIDFGVNATKKRKNFEVGTEEGSDINSKRLKANSTKMFLNRQTAAKTEKMKIRKIAKTSGLKQTFTVAKNENSRSSYDVEIASVCSCTCSDFKKNRSKVVCKHIIFVCMVVLGKDFGEQLKNRFICEEDLKQLFGGKVDEKWMQTKKRKLINRKDFASILSDHPKSNDSQVWHLHKKTARCAKCTSLKCRKVISVGTECFSIQGALTVPYNGKNAVEQKFYFCSNKTCIKDIPPWTNIERLSTTNVTAEDYETNEVVQRFDLQL